MKKLFLLLIFTLLLQNIVNAQYKTYRKNIYVKFSNYENVSTKLETIIDSINFEFEPNTENFWGINITNNGTQKVYILWNDAVFGTGSNLSKIVFNTDNRLLMNSEKPPEIIYPGLNISKQIDNVMNFSSSDYIGQLYYSKYLDNGLEWRIKLIIPIKIGDIQKDYIFEFIVYKKQ